MTVTTVSNDRKRKPTEKETLIFTDRMWELQRRFREGSLDPVLCADSLQYLIEAGAIVADDPVEPQQTAQVNRVRKLDLQGVHLAVHARMKTEYCLRRGVERNARLDELLSDHVPEVDAGILGGFETADKNGMTFHEMTQCLLGASDSDAELKRGLKSCNLLLHLEQVTDLLIRTKEGQATGLLTNTNVNIFPVGDEKGEVFFIIAGWINNGWHVFVYEFGNRTLWDEGRRFFFRTTPEPSSR